jgi:hypothetical protein
MISTKGGAGTKPPKPYALAQAMASDERIGMANPYSKAVTEPSTVYVLAAVLTVLIT